MPPKTNSKAVAGRARKQEQADKKAADASEKAEAAEAAKWQQGSKGKGATDARADKAAEAAKKKAEKERLKAEDEAAIPDKKPKGNSGGKAGKKDPKSTSKSSGAVPDNLDNAFTEFSASNIDDAIAAMSLTNEKMDKASQGSKAGGIERHPERRFKAAFEAYKEREMPRIKEERPGLRQQQYQDALFKEFQKSSENPFNQLTVSYDANKDERLNALQHQREKTAKRLGS